jgi:hypothetical protein
MDKSATPRPCTNPVLEFFRNNPCYGVVSFVLAVAGIASIGIQRLGWQNSFHGCGRNASRRTHLVVTYTQSLTKESLIYQGIHERESGGSRARSGVLHAWYVAFSRR